MGATDQRKSPTDNGFSAYVELATSGIDYGTELVIINEADRLKTTGLDQPRDFSTPTTSA